MKFILLIILLLFNIEMMASGRNNNPDSLFLRRQEIARQLQETESGPARNKADRLRKELLKTDSLLIYNYLLRYARSNQKLENELKKINLTNTSLQKETEIHRSLIRERENTLKFLVISILVVLILLSVVVSLYVERYLRVKKLNARSGISESRNRDLVNQVEELSRKVEAMTDHERLISENSEELKKNLLQEIESLRNRNRELSHQADKEKEKLSSELQVLLNKLRESKA